MREKLLIAIGMCFIGVGCIISVFRFGSWVFKSPALYYYATAHCVRQDTIISYSDGFFVMNSGPFSVSDVKLMLAKECSVPPSKIMVTFFHEISEEDFLRSTQEYSRSIEECPKEIKKV